MSEFHASRSRRRSFDNKSYDWTLVKSVNKGTIRIQKQGISKFLRFEEHDTEGGGEDTSIIPFSTGRKLAILLTNCTYFRGCNRLFKETITVGWGPRSTASGGCCRWSRSSKHISPNRIIATGGYHSSSLGRRTCRWGSSLRRSHCRRLIIRWCDGGWSRRSRCSRKDRERIASWLRRGGSGVRISTRWRRSSASVWSSWLCWWLRLRWGHRCGGSKSICRDWLRGRCLRSRRLLLCPRIGSCWCRRCCWWHSRNWSYRSRPWVRLLCCWNQSSCGVKRSWRWC
mmetsp:Transcript_17248/g.26696  ORF Transcript_17248/g.26696 Transcript_17248/m.26696 type:complete len:284 (-) Transcript_17248:687-1538(-)